MLLIFTKTHVNVIYYKDTCFYIYKDTCVINIYMFINIDKDTCLFIFTKTHVY